MFAKLVFLAGLVALTLAEDLSGGGDGTNMEFSTGYSAQGTTDTRLRPSGVFYAYGGGKFSNTQGEPEYGQARTTGLITSISNSLGLGEGRSLAYVGGGAALGMAAYYLYSISNFSGLKKAAEKLTGSSKKKVDKSEAKKDKEQTGVSENVHDRRRRSTVMQMPASRDDQDLTHLTSIVVNAIQSGECLQKTVCLVGQQVSNRRGRVAEAVLSAVLPEQVQRSSYYNILVQSLKGETDCSQFKCNV